MSHRARDQGNSVAEGVNQSTIPHPSPMNYPLKLDS